MINVNHASSNRLQVSIKRTSAQPGELPSFWRTWDKILVDIEIVDGCPSQSFTKLTSHAVLNNDQSDILTTLKGKRAQALNV